MRTSSDLQLAAQQSQYVQTRQTTQEASVGDQIEQRTDSFESSGQLVEIDRKFTSDDPIVRKIYYKMSEENYEEILRILEETVHKVDIMSILDKKHFTLLHKIAFHMEAADLEYVYTYAMRSCSPLPSAMKAWINAQNDEGTTCLHLAVFKGDLSMIQFLVAAGADPSILNYNGLSIFHIAAQGDQPISMAYFSAMQSLNIRQRDSKNGTALHWACFLGCENSVNFLLTLIPDTINQADNEGLTPLHLAVISGNARIVKKLLQRGSDKRARDQNEQTASDLAKDNEFNNIYAMLEDTGGFQEYCNIKTPFKPVGKSMRQILVFILLYIIVQAAVIALIFPFFNSTYWEVSLWVIVSAGTLYGFIGGCIVSAGFVSGIMGQSKLASSLKSLETQSKKQTNNNNNNNSNDGNASQYQRLLEQEQQSSSFVGVSTAGSGSASTPEYDVNRIRELIRLYALTSEDSRVCVECCIEKPKRSRHCEICKKCVRVYDHHCPWINNCVGAENFRYFMTFIVFLWFTMVYTVYLIGSHLSAEYTSIDVSDAPFNWYENSTEDMLDALFVVKYIASGCVLMFVVFFLVLHTILCYVQISNLFLNQTTFERYNSHGSSKQQHQQQQATPAGTASESQAQLQLGGSDQQNDRSSENGQMLKDSLNQSGQSSSFVNPSLIMTNTPITSRFSQNQKNDSDVKRISCTNALLMCCGNKHNREYDYLPPISQA